MDDSHLNMGTHKQDLSKQEQLHLSGMKILYRKDIVVMVCRRVQISVP